MNILLKVLRAAPESETNLEAGDKLKRVWRFCYGIVLHKLSKACDWCFICWPGLVGAKGPACIAE